MNNNPFWKENKHLYLLYISFLTWPWKITYLAQEITAFSLNNIKWGNSISQNCSFCLSPFIATIYWVLPNSWKCDTLPILSHLILKRTPWLCWSPFHRRWIYSKRGSMPHFQLNKWDWVLLIMALSLLIHVIDHSFCTITWLLLFGSSVFLLRKHKWMLIIPLYFSNYCKRYFKI